MQLTIQIDFCKIDLMCNQIIHENEIKDGLRHYYMNLLFKTGNQRINFDFHNEKLNSDIILFEAKFRNPSYVLYLFQTEELSTLDLLLQHLDSKAHKSIGMFLVQSNYLWLNMSNYRVSPGFWMDNLFKHFTQVANPEKLTNLLGGDL